MPKIPRTIATIVRYTNIPLILVFIFKQQLPPEVPVFYGRPEGEEVLGGSLSLMIPALTSLIITTVNLSLTSFVESPFLKKTLAASALVATLFSVITTLKIFILVT